MLHRRGGDLSGGQQQQLAIARALAAGPKLLILDEPTEGIQPSIIKDIGRVIRMLADRGTMAIVLVEQYYDFAAELADQYLVMERGESLGMRRGCLGRWMLLIHGKSRANTSRYRKRRALSAWLWVEAETLRSVASMARKASTSGAPMSRGCRKPCQRMKKRTQKRYTFSVLKL
jgi:energy-coupling factor transporter ATP-binding protein EcfA2